MTVDIVIKNGKIFTSHGLFEAGVAIEGGKIVSIAKDAHLPSANEVVDVSGNLVMPGAIDTHVHVHIPYLFYREDFANATKAAAAGGTTMVFDFAFTGEKGLLDSFKKMKEDGEKLSTIDFGLHPCVRHEKHFDEIPIVAKEGATSFKHLMANCNGTPFMDSGLLLESFKAVGKANSLAMVHAENEYIRERSMRMVKKAGRNDALAHADSRPTIVEAEAISRAILLAREAGVPLHICHVSSREGAKFIGDAKKAGQPVTGETCPHFLFFSRDDLEKFGPYLQVNPCLKSKADSESLWTALEDGTIDTVVTDHYAPLKEEKEKGWKNAWEVEGGVPGVETRVMLMMSEGVNKGRISLERFVDILSTSPAKIFGIYPKKGAIQIGSDADIVVIDRKKEFTIRADSLHHKADWTPFEGWKVKGVPMFTLVRGEFIMKDGEVLDKPGYGKFVGRIV